MSSKTAQLLSQLSRGGEGAVRRMMPDLYGALRELAGRYLSPGGGAVTLQPTALVHEAFVRLAGQKTADFSGQTHFYAVAAVAMRHILIDQARKRQRIKRGGDRGRVTLTDGVAVGDTGEIDLLALEDALVKLGEMDPRGAQVVELRFFGGLTERQVAEVLGVSERTVQSDWRVARAWLRRELGPPGSEDES